MIEKDKNTEEENLNNNSEENSSGGSSSSSSGNSGGENLQQGTKTIIKKTGAYAEVEVVEEGKPNQDNSGKKSGTGSSDKKTSSSSIDESQMGPSMGTAKDENYFTDPDTQDSKKGGGAKLKARLQNFIAGLGQDKIQLKGEYKGDVNINDVKISDKKETFESRLRQTEKQQETLDKTIEVNANKNGVVRRVLAKLEEKIEKNPELAEKFDTKAEIIKHVGHVPSSQMSHVDKLLDRANKIQEKSPFDL